jgi:hypothetical protein
VLHSCTRRGARGVHAAHSLVLHLMWGCAATQAAACSAHVARCTLYWRTGAVTTSSTAAREWHISLSASHASATDRIGIAEPLLSPEVAAPTSAGPAVASTPSCASAAACEVQLMDIPAACYPQRSMQHAANAKHTLERHSWPAQHVVCKLSQRQGHCRSSKAGRPCAVISPRCPTPTAMRLPAGRVGLWPSRCRA